MLSFPQMMESIRAGQFDEEIPESVERAGVISPMFMLRMARQDSEHSYTATLFEAVGMALNNVDEYVAKEISGRPEVMAAAQSYLGKINMLTGHPMTPQDLIMARISWRLSHVGSRLEVNTWHSIKTATTKNPGQDTWSIRWPDFNDEAVQFWPVQYLKQALKLALFSGALNMRSKAPKH
jgi:hypothetical protein